MKASTCIKSTLTDIVSTVEAIFPSDNNDSGKSDAEMYLQPSLQPLSYHKYSNRNHVSFCFGTGNIQICNAEE
jgi:hypothetical protein